MRIALISDIHGNLLALESVLAECRARGVDSIICLGDVATLGPCPVECLDRIRAEGCVCVLGNHDEFLLAPSLVASYTQVPFIRAAIDWCREQLGEERLQFVRRFVPTHLVRDGARSLHVFHGSPQSNTQDLLAETPEAEVTSALGGHDADVHAGGHTHLPIVRRVRSGLSMNPGLLVNPGSVGLPFETFVGAGVPRVLAQAEYAIVELTAKATRVELHRIELDRGALRAQAQRSEWPMSSQLAEQYS